MTTKRKKASEERVRVIKTDYPKPDSYTAAYSCANCGWSGSIRFKKGKEALATTNCPTCECFSAKKSLPYVRRELVPTPPSDQGNVGKLSVTMSSMFGANSKSTGCQSCPR